MLLLCALWAAAAAGPAEFAGDIVAVGDIATGAPGDSPSADVVPADLAPGDLVAADLAPAGVGPVDGAPAELGVPVPLTELRPGVRFIPERWTIPEATLSAVRAIQTATIGRRMEAASRGWLGLPYLNEAAGEDDADDPDPPARYDSFDCLTFVEEVLGLTLAGDPLHAPSVRDALRYKNAGPRPAWRRSYDERRHFMEAEWLPDAVRDGLLVDITDRVGPARQLVHVVTTKTWQNWRHTRFFHLPPALYPVGPWTMQYLDLPTAAASVQNIPPGALVLTMRQPQTWAPIVITHVSLVVQDESGKVHMRHATRMGSQKVRDDDLTWYVNHLNDYVKWPSLGIAVYLPREQGPRISALTPLPLHAPFPLPQSATFVGNP